MTERDRVGRMIRPPAGGRWGSFDPRPVTVTSCQRGRAGRSWGASGETDPCRVLTGEWLHEGQEHRHAPRRRRNDRLAIAPWVGGARRCRPAVPLAEKWNNTDSAKSDVARSGCDFQGDHQITPTTERRRWRLRSILGGDGLTEFTANCRACSLVTVTALIDGACGVIVQGARAQSSHLMAPAPARHCAVRRATLARGPGDPAAGTTCSSRISATASNPSPPTSHRHRRNPADVPPGQTRTYRSLGRPPTETSDDVCRPMTRPRSRR